MAEIWQKYSKVFNVLGGDYVVPDYIASYIEFTEYTNFSFYRAIAGH